MIDRIPAHQLILADLTPIRPLPRPWKRAAGVWPLAVLVVLFVVARYGLRQDAPLLGWTGMWGLSSIQFIYGCLLIAAALRQAVPGRTFGRAAGTMLIAGGAALSLTVTLVTWHVHPSSPRPDNVLRYWDFCFVRSVLFGMPVLLVTQWMIARAYQTHPALTGCLAGLGSGLLVDAGWRTFCEVSAPSHVVSAHFASVVTLTLVGAAVATAHAAWYERRRTTL